MEYFAKEYFFSFLASTLAEIQYMYDSRKNLSFFLSIFEGILRKRICLSFFVFTFEGILRKRICLSFRPPLKGCFDKESFLPFCSIWEKKIFYPFLPTPSGHLRKRIFLSFLSSLICKKKNLSFCFKQFWWNTLRKTLPFFFFLFFCALSMKYIAKESSFLFFFFVQYSWSTSQKNLSSFFVHVWSKTSQKNLTFFFVHSLCKISHCTHSNVMSRIVHILKKCLALYTL